MGKTGTGKSTLCNALLYGPYFDDKKKFDMSASINSCTHKTTFQTDNIWTYTQQKFTIVDTPGLSDNPKDDAKFIKEMIECIRNEVCDVSLFLFVVNGNEIRWDSNTTNLVKIFEDNFGTGFWKHFAIVYTMWSYGAKGVKIRER